MALRAGKSPPFRGSAAGEGVAPGPNPYIMKLLVKTLVGVLCVPSQVMLYIALIYTFLVLLIISAPLKMCGIVDPELDAQLQKTFNQLMK
jgi:hypothetical protein